VGVEEDGGAVRGEDGEGSGIVEAMGEFIAGWNVS